MNVARQMYEAELARQAAEAAAMLAKQNATEKAIEDFFKPFDTFINDFNDAAFWPKGLVRDTGLTSSIQRWLWPPLLCSVIGAQPLPLKLGRGRRKPEECYSIHLVLPMIDADELAGRAFITQTKGKYAVPHRIDRSDDDLFDAPALAFQALMVLLTPHIKPQ